VTAELLQRLGDELWSVVHPHTSGGRRSQHLLQLVDGSQTVACSQAIEAILMV
jgi:hypothetical protein